ncbi:MAG: DUF89 family protein [Deltaproteobacteria bacterium]|nr:DUF89 family protein [Deltaproteobacteria bacterium]
MKTYLDCYPCFLRQALSASRRAGADPEQEYAVMQRVLALLQSLERGATPPEIGYEIHRAVREEITAEDPYHEDKVLSTQQALTLYPRLESLVAQSDDALEVSVRLSIAGNIIDFGVTEQHDDLWSTVERVLAQPFAIDDLGALRAELARADHVLFLADNAGETVFDRLLVEVLPVPVVYAVKGGPILNDATLEDATAAGLDRCATLITTGSDVPGTILSRCSDEFRRHFESAPVVIAKGQGNYETLSEAGPTVFCLLQVKCPVIGDDIGAPAGSIVVRRSS